MTEPRETRVTVFTPLSVIERLDDEAILAELKGEVVKEYVYRFPGREKGTEIINLSKAGIDACVSALAHRGEALRELEFDYKDTGDHYEFICTVGRYAVSSDGETEVLLDTAKGFKRQWKKMRLKTGQIVDNEFFFEVGAIKAVRNAKNRLISQEIKTAIIKEARKEKRVREVTEAEAAEVEPETRRTVYDSWLKICPEHRISWQQGEWDLYHRTKEGKACSLGKVLSNELTRLVERGEVDVKDFYSRLRERYGKPFSQLDNQDKIEILDELAVKQEVENAWR